MKTNRFSWVNILVIAGLFLTAACSEDVEEGPQGPTIIQPMVEFPGTLENWCSTPFENFSFFVTSITAMWDLSGSDREVMLGSGFGGDFKGLEGADSICQHIAIATGHGKKRWRAFLSVVDGGDGNPIHAIDRIGSGPWYDANNRLIANDKAGLMGVRPDGDPQAIEDLADECGLPISAIGDAHDVVTGSNREGKLRSTNPESTCMDWTSSDGSVGNPGRMDPNEANAPPDTAVFCGHSFPRQFSPPGREENWGKYWMSDHQLRGCGKGGNLLQNGPGVGDCIGCSGGYGALYCFVADD